MAGPGVMQQRVAAKQPIKNRPERGGGGGEWGQARPRKDGKMEPPSTKLALGAKPGLSGVRCMISLIWPIDCLGGYSSTDE